MRFSYSSNMQKVFPNRVTAVLAVDDVHDHADVAEAAATFAHSADARLAEAPESAFPEIQAWRKAFSTMGLKPTQYRCAAEALLRRHRKEGGLPSLHPLVDLCNAASIAFAVPIAVFDRSRVEGDLVVREADGTERYETFGGGIEHPEPGDIIFVDDSGNAHARRWANHQSGRSAVSAATTRALIVAEALHDRAAADMQSLVRHLAPALRNAYGITPVSSLLLQPDAVFRHPAET